MRQKPSLSELKTQIRGVRTLAKKEWPIRQSLFCDALRAFFIGAEDEGKKLLRDVVNASIGFERLANATGLSSKSIHRMLTKNGNPTSHNLFLLIRTICIKEGFEVRIEVTTTSSIGKEVKPI